MLETDDVDADYFTPLASTSLANIFGEPTNNDAEKGNTSLKYTPPKPKTVVPKLEEPKATQCIFACALIGYEWFNNVYNTRGKLGFAILKIVKSGYHNIVLYDANKTTLSCTTISSTLEVSVKGCNISYYDNANKYWNLTCTTEDETFKIIEVLKKFDTVIKQSTYNEKGFPEPGRLDSESNKEESDKDKSDIRDTESDVYSLNKRTKLSILSRMASMGQSVLPTHIMQLEKSSDSSDNESNISLPPKAVRHKGMKYMGKRNIPDKSIPDIQSVVEAYPRAKSGTECISLYTQDNRQIVPVTNTNANPHISIGCDMNLFVSEQRMNNSELRINVNRMMDKVDLILDKVKSMETTSNPTSSSSFQNDIFRKLLTEYENKIKICEDLIKSKHLDDNVSFIASDLNRESSLESYKNDIIELKKKHLEKDNEICRLNEKIEVLLKQNKKIIEAGAKVEENLMEEIKKLNHELSLKIENYDKIKTFVTDKSNLDTGMQNKIKNIMNDTFHTISANFENSETYTGESVKNVIAKVIKKVTMDSLKML